MKSWIKDNRNFSLFMSCVAVDDAGLYECILKENPGKNDNVLIERKFHITVSTGQRRSTSINESCLQDCSSISPPICPFNLSSVPFLCVSAIMALLFFLCIVFAVKLFRIKRDGHEADEN